jgi:hypothetical protein
VIIVAAMSPIAALAPGSASKDYKRESTLARLLGSGMFPGSHWHDGMLIFIGSAGIAELAVFHPVWISILSCQ